MEISVTKQTPTKGAGGRGRARGDGRFSIKDQKQGSAILKRKQINISEVNKAFRIRFVRLNGILFTRTRYALFQAFNFSS
jgi:protein SMG7